MRLFEELRGLGYEGGYDAVRRYASAGGATRSRRRPAAFVPLSFAPGEAYQFDWSHEIVVINGVTTTVKVAHVRLCHSRMLFVRAYPRETQEMVFDAHDRAFAFFKGACTRGIYDNMKTAVDTVFVGKERAYNRRFLQMCSHYLVEPVACTPASGWEKGQVENQVGLVRRQRFFTPRLRFKSYEELNAWLLDHCVAWAKAHRHPEVRTRRSGRCSRPSGRAWCPMPAGSTASTPCRPRCRRPAWSASTTTNTRSSASAVGRPVEIRAYAERIELRQDGRIVGEHRRVFGRGQTVYDPWHYVPVLARKPGALRNGAPFKDWVLPAALERVRRKLRSARRRRPPDGGHPERGADRRPRRGRGRLRRGARRGRPLGRRHPQHPGATARSAGRRRRSRRPTRCGCAASPQPTAPATTASGGPSDGTIRNPHRDGRAQALRHEGSLSTRSSPIAVKRQHEPQRIIGDLLTAEISEKQARSIKYQLTVAKLPLRQGDRRVRLRRHAGQRDPGA